jgi:glycosyltransferase involved in cell wall biosynthesis
MQRIITLYHNFKNEGGAQNIALTLASELSSEKNPLVLSFTSSQKINKTYKQMSHRFEKLNFTSVLKLKNSDIILSHHRSVTTFIIILKFLFYRKFRIIHVAHNVFYNYKYFTIFPKEVVAVSKAVKNNLISYFGVRPENIFIIYNGVKEDNFEKAYTPKNNNNNNINILYPARITEVKGQLNFTRITLNKLNSNINISFAGQGELIDELRELTQSSKQFKVLGHINEINELYTHYDYVCLFSSKEGLPISLIEACKYGLPIVSNGIGGIGEIVINNFNGFIVNEYASLADFINKLPSPATEAYKLLSLNSKKMYENFFNYNQMIDSYKKLIYQNTSLLENNI